MVNSIPLQGIDNFIKDFDQRIGKATSSLKTALEKVPLPIFRKERKDKLENIVPELSPADLLLSRKSFYDTLVSNQMNPWFKNPFWDDSEPTVRVSEPAGYFCQMDGKFTVGLPPGKVLDILCDPENIRIFKNIKELKYRRLLRDDGEEIETYVEQKAAWRFLWLTGTFDVCLNCMQNRRTNYMRFSLTKSGFMKKFEGSWEIFPLPVDKKNEIDIETFSSDTYPHSPSSHLHYLPSPFPSSPSPSRSIKSDKRSSDAKDANGNDNGDGYDNDSDVYKHDDGDKRLASIVILKQCFEPAINPPFFLKNYVRGITASVSKQIFSDLQKEARRVRHRKEVGWKEDEREMEEWREKEGKNDEKSMAYSNEESKEDEKHGGNGREKKRRSKTKKWRKRVVAVE